MEVYRCVQEPRCLTTSSKPYFEDEILSPFTGQSIGEITNDSVLEKRDQNLIRRPLVAATPTNITGVTAAETLASSVLAAAQASEGAPQQASKGISARQPELRPNRTSLGNPLEKVTTKWNLVSEHRSHRMLRTANSQLLKPFKIHPPGHSASRTRSRLLRGTRHLAHQVFRHILEHQHPSGSTLAERLCNSELSVIMQNDPKYRRLLRVVPVLVKLLPSNIRDGLASKEGAALLEFGMLVAGKVVSRASDT